MNRAVTFIFLAFVGLCGFAALVTTVFNDGENPIGLSDKEMALLLICGLLAWMRVFSHDKDDSK